MYSMDGKAFPFLVKNLIGGKIHPLNWKVLSSENTCFWLGRFPFICNWVHLIKLFQLFHKWSFHMKFLKDIFI